MVSWAKQLKRESRSVLFGNYRIFLFATLFFTAISFGFLLISQSSCDLLCTAASASDEVFFMISLTLDIGCFIICFPFLCGYVSLCSEISCGKHCELSGLFVFYERKRLASCYVFLMKLILRMLLRVVLPFVLLGIITEYANGISDDLFSVIPQSVRTAIPALTFVIQILVIFTVFYLAGGLILSVIGFCGGSSIKLCASERRHFFILRASLIPLYILSVLTFGMLFICYTLPFTLIVYSRFTKGLHSENTSRSEKDKLPYTQLFDISKKESKDQH